MKKRTLLKRPWQKWFVLSTGLLLLAGVYAAANTLWRTNEYNYADLRQSAYTSERTTLFYEPFRENAAPYWASQNLSWGMQTGPGHIGTPGQWQLTLDLGFDIVTQGAAEQSIEPSGGYIGGYKNSKGSSAPSGGSVLEPRTWSKKGFAFYGIDTKKYRDVWIECAMLGKDGKGNPTGLKIEYSSNNGATWTDLDWKENDLEKQEGNGGWLYVKFKKTLPSVSNLFIKVSSSSTSDHSYMDDIAITAEYDYSFNLKEGIASTENTLKNAVIGKELGMYYLSSDDLKQKLTEAIAIRDKTNSTNEEAYNANQALVTALAIFENHKITRTNAPNVDQVADQSFSFSNETKTINLTGIKAVGGASITSVTPVSKKGNCVVSGVTGIGTERSFTYTGNSGHYGKDTIVVTVVQSSKPEGVITQEIEISFAVEMLDGSVNIPPVVDKIPTQYNILSDGIERTMSITGISAVNPGQKISSVNVKSDNPNLVISSAVNYSSVNETGKATFKYTPLLNTQGKATLTITIEDDAFNTPTGEKKRVESFDIYFYTENSMAATFDNPGTIEIKSGVHEIQVILGNVRNAANISEGFEVEVLSGAELLDETPVINYNKENRDFFATMNVKLKGDIGTARFRVSIDGKNEQEFDLEVYQYSNPGINIQVYDVSRNDQPNVIEKGAVPVYEETVQTALFPAETDVFWWPAGYTKPGTEEQIAASKWTSIFPNITATTCSSGACNPDPIPDLIVTGMKGFFIPEKTGNYTFQYNTQEIAGGVFLDQTGISWKVAKKIAYLGTSGNVGTLLGNTITSEEISLEKGKIYPLYALKFCIHRLEFGIKVKGPDDNEFTTIPANLLAYTYDAVLPDVPTGLKINTVLANSLKLVWNEVLQGAKIAAIAGYNIYLNGKKANTDPIKETSFMLGNLQEKTDYQVFVTAVDKLGNESFVSNSARATTLINSSEKPSGNITVRELGKTGQTVKIKYSGAVAPTGSAIVAYDVALGGTAEANIINSDYIYADTCFVKGLEPEKEYDVYVRGYTASMVQGEWSAAQKISTAAFDPMDELGLEYGEHRIALDVEKSNISWSEGVGINSSLKSKSFYENQGENDEKARTTAMNPGVIRWGALDANMYGLLTVTGSTEDAGNYASSIGKTRKDKGLPTHAMNMGYANQIGSMYSLCIGMKQGLGGLGTASGDYSVDYMEGVKFDVNGTPNISEAKARTFRILFEYLAGSKDTEGGKIRAEEGFEEPLLSKDKSKGLILEFGNEVWGSTSHNAPLGKNYNLYTQWCRNMTDSIRALPFWNEIKDVVYFAYNGRDPGLDTNGTIVIDGDKGELQVLSVSGYLGGNMNYNPEVDYGETVREYYQLRQKQMSERLTALENALRYQVIKRGSPMYHYFYETQVSVDTYFGRLGQAIVLGDYLSSSLKYGGIVPAIFVYTGGQWGITVQGTPLSHYYIAQLINTYCKGHVVSSSVRSNNRLIAEDKPLESHDPVGTSVYNNGKQWSILLFSRDFEEDYSVQLNLPKDIGEIKNAKRVIITDDANKLGVESKTEFSRTEEDVTLINGQLVSIPKYSVVLYTFEANDPGFEKLPLGYFTYKKATGIEFEGSDSTPFQITEKGKSTDVKAIVIPEDAFVNTVNWEFSKEDNSGYSGLPRIKNYVSDANTVTIQSNVTGLCDGPYYLRASLKGDSTVTAVQAIELSNQGNNCMTPTPIEEISANNTLIYPNPVENILYINISFSGERATVRIYNQIGVTLLSKSFTSEQTELDVSSLVPGFYFVRIEKGSTSETFKIFKK